MLSQTTVIQPHHEHLKQLISLASADDPVSRTLSNVGAQQGWWSRETSWTRSYGRYPAGLAPYAILVYESNQIPKHLCLVEIGKDGPPQTAPNTVVQFDELFGWITICRFPFDPHLPTLKSVWEATENASVVRYRPHWRCTMRSNTGKGIQFVKVFRRSDGDVEALHHAGVAIWNAASQGELAFDVAMPEGFDTELNTIWQGNVVGVPAESDLYGARGIDMSKSMGFACASIPKANLRPTNILNLESHLASTTVYADVVRARIPELAGKVDNFLEELSTYHHAISDRPLRPIHGSPHPSQWLINNGRLGLVDFDRFSLGDPELDVATFTSEVDFMKSTTISTEKLNQAFIDGYEACYGKLDPERLRLYRAHKRFAKVHRTACGLRPDAPLRSAQHMALVMERFRSA